MKLFFQIQSFVNISLVHLLLFLQQKLNYRVFLGLSLIAFITVLSVPLIVHGEYSQYGYLTGDYPCKTAILITLVL